MTDAQVEEIKRHFGVVVEALRIDIHQIAEGHSGIRHGLQEIRDEFRDEFKEMRALMRLSFSQFDQRIPTYEQTFPPSRQGWIVSKPTKSNSCQLLLS
ncbi:MAG: hypothetical protein AB7P24_10440 [Nitrospira sp.]